MVGLLPLFFECVSSKGRLQYNEQESILLLTEVI